MAEKAPHTHGHGHAHGHGYLPAMGHDRLLRFYDPFTRLLGVRSAHRRLAAQAGIQPGDRVLEIGTGTGNLALLVAREHPGAEVVGLDPDPLALAMARRKAARRGRQARFDVGTAAVLPYPDESVDRVLSSLMFHHLDEDEKRRALAEVRRVLKPGGSLHIMDFGGRSNPGPIIRMLQRRNPLMHANAGDGILERLRAAGFADPAQVDDRSGMAYFRATR
jgi:ubiquinone/menaquinone biosynthesis C-methylase UbiE